MENRTPLKPTSKRRINGEVRLGLVLLFLTLFELILLVVLVVQAFQPTKQPVEPNQPGDSTLDNVQNSDPPTEQPVFSGAVLSTLPYQTERTQLISMELASRYAVLVDCTTGEIVASLRASERFSPASMTKVMTLIVACEQLSEEDLNRQLTLTQEITDYVTSGEYLGMELSLINGDLYLNDRFYIRDLLYGIGMASAADCTYMVCREISGSEEAFVELMNQKCREMGLTDTHFDNIIGYESENNYTTARDMAAIMMYAMQSDLIADILGRTSYYSFEGYYTENGVEKHYSRGYNSTLQSRKNSYRTHFGVDFELQTARLLGGKTGYLESNGIKNQCLVLHASSKSDGDKYVLVVGGSEELQYYTMKDIKSILDFYIQ